jgi:hypothetical protein
MLRRRQNRVNWDRAGSHQKMMNARALQNARVRPAGVPSCGPGPVALLRRVPPSCGNAPI